MLRQSDTDLPGRGAGQGLHGDVFDTRSFGNVNNNVLHAGHSESQKSLNLWDWLNKSFILLQSDEFLYMFLHFIITKQLNSLLNIQR